MVKYPLKSAEEFATAFEKNDQRVLRATRQNFVDGIAVTVPEVKNLTIANFPAFIRGLQEIPCPSGEGTLSRVLAPSGVLDFFWKRQFRPGERCLFDNNTGRIILSLYCGNLILFPKSPTPEAIATIQPKKEKEETKTSEEVPAKVQPGVSVTIEARDSVNLQMSTRLGIMEGIVKKDTSFAAGNSQVSIVLRKSPPAQPVSIPVREAKKGNFFTSKKFWIPFALVTGGVGGFFLGQEMVTVKCVACGG